MNKYTVKQILFGIRNEYIKNQIELNQLRNYISKKNENVQYDIYYNISYKNDLYSLICAVKSRNTLLRRMITSLLASSNNEIVLNDKFLGRFHSIKFSELDHGTDKLFVDENMLRHLHHEANDILNSDFVNNMYVKHYIDEKNKTDLMITPNSASVGAYQGSIYPPASIYYRPAGDKIETINYYDYFFKDDFYRMMDIEIPEKNLNSYIIDKIEKHDVKDKELIIDDLNLDSKKQYFKIDEDEKTIKLTK